MRLFIGYLYIQYILEQELLSSVHGRCGRQRWLAAVEGAEEHVSVRRHVKAAAAHCARWHLEPHISSSGGAASVDS